MDGSTMKRSRPWQHVQRNRDIAFSRPKRPARTEPESESERSTRIMHPFAGAGVTVGQAKTNLAANMKPLGQSRPFSRGNTMQVDFKFSPGETVAIKLTGAKGTVCSCTADGAGNGYTVRTANDKGELTRTYFSEFELGEIGAV